MQTVEEMIDTVAGSEPVNSEPQEIHRTLSELVAGGRRVFAVVRLGDNYLALQQSARSQEEAEAEAAVLAIKHPTEVFLTMTAVSVHKVERAERRSLY